MASSIIHMAVAREINKKLKRNESVYLIGSIAPDIAKIIGIQRSITHFEIENSGIPSLESFLSKYEKELNDDFVMGYYIHLLTDYFWYKYFYTEIVNENTITKLDGTKVKVTNEEITKLIYNDYTNLNKDLIKKYSLNIEIFYNKVPFIKEKIKEIPIKDIDKLINQMGIIIKKTEEHKNYVFNMKDVEKFIDISVKLIKSILNEKGYLKVTNSNC